MTNPSERAAFRPADRDDEQALVQRVVAGERTAFELLMRRHNRRLYRLARSMLRNDAEAEDALQEAYLSAYRSISRFRGEASLATWLSRMVLNECLGRLRRQARRENVVPMVRPATDNDVEPDFPAPTETSAPDQALARAEVRMLIERHLDQLPQAFRIVFVMREVEEMSVEETSQCLDIPEATVRSRHFRARSMLREALAREIDLAERSLYDFGGVQCDRVVQSVMARVDQEN